MNIHFKQPIQFSSKCIDLNQTSYLYHFVAYHYNQGKSFQEYYFDTMTWCKNFFSNQKELLESRILSCFCLTMTRRMVQDSEVNLLYLLQIHPPNQSLSFLDFFCQNIPPKLKKFYHFLTNNLRDQFLLKIIELVSLFLYSIHQQADVYTWVFQFFRFFHQFLQKS